MLALTAGLPALTGFLILIGGDGIGQQEPAQPDLWQPEVHRQSRAVHDTGEMTAL